MDTRASRVLTHCVYGLQSAFEELAKDKQLSGQAKDVFLYLIARLDSENYVPLMQTQIAEALVLSKNRIWEAMVKLVAKGLILKGPKLGHSWSYRLNPRCGWYGFPRRWTVCETSRGRRKCSQDDVDLIADGDDPNRVRSLDEIVQKLKEHGLHHIVLQFNRSEVTLTARKRKSRRKTGG